MAVVAASAACCELLAGAKTAACITPRVLVSFSGGKDSVVTLDLCTRYFSDVQAFMMLFSPVLSFHQTMIRWLKLHYNIDLFLVPHPDLSEWFRYGFLRVVDPEVPVISFNDVYAYVRASTGIWWIAAGERIADSLVRRAMIKSGGGVVNTKRGRFFPVAHWTKSDIMDYIRQRRLKISPEAAYMPGKKSFASLLGYEIAAIKQRNPADYEKLKSWFPLLDYNLKRYEYGYEKVPRRK